jgi:tetratricopeptide (TPR) repeat protein
MADRFGWEEMAQDVAGVYRQAKADSGGDVGITARNWGEASALHVYAAEFGLPEPICGDGWFYFEGLRRGSFPDRVVSVGSSRSRLLTLFRNVELKKVFTNPYCMPDENNGEIYYCSGPKVDLQRYWELSRRMDPRFSEVLRTGGVQQAADLYHRLKNEDPRILLFSEERMNTVGYEYLGRGQVKEAIVLFMLNVEAYPESFNVYDSLGEAQMADHQYALAVQNYTRSVEINPGNKNAQKKLRELKALVGR